MSGAEVALRPEDEAVHGFEVAERVFNEQRRGEIAQFLNIKADDPALLPFLVTCATYGLSPVMGQIWLIPQNVTVRDGDADRKEKRYRPAVGRDGYLAIAHRDPRFKGLAGATVCEFDTFDVQYTGDIDADPTVLHRFASKPTVFEESDDPTRWRGKVLGAWAKCYIQGQPPVFYYASLREHGKLEQEWDYDESARKRKPLFFDAEGRKTFTNTGKPVMKWAGAWEYVSTMILKAAQSWVLRIGIGITGLAPADEMVSGELTPGEAGPAALPMSDEFDWSTLNASDAVRERLRAAIEAANELAPLSWTAAKCEMVLGGASEDDLEQQAETVERENELHAQRIDPPAPGEATTAEAADPQPVGQREEEEPQEAQVVRPLEELDEKERAEVARLRNSEADLISALDEASPGSDEYMQRNGELEQIEGRLRELGQRPGPMN